MSEVHDLMPSFNFVLLVNGIDEIPLKSVQPFTRDNEYEPIQEGGMNDYVYLKRKPISQPFKLVVERYVDYSLGLADPLTNGTELLLPLILFVGKNVGGNFDSGRYYTFTGAVIMGIQYGGLDAEKGGLLTETITIGYNHMFSITLPNSESESAPAWSMIKNKLKPKYSLRGFNPKQNEERWDDIDYGPTGDNTIRDKARRWDFDEKKSKGQGKASHRVLSRSKEEDKAERRKYNFSGENNPEHKGDKKSTRSAQNSAYSDKTLGPKLGIKELSKDEMAKKSNKFELDENGVYTGNGWHSAKHNPIAKEKRIKDMQDAAVQWEFDNRVKGGKGTQSAQNALVTEHRELEGGGSVGLGRPEESKETLAGRAVKGAKNTDAGVVGTDPKPRRWKFDEGKTKEGTGDRSRQNAVKVSNKETTGLGVTESTKEEFASATHKWAFAENDKYAVKGNQVQSAREPEGINQETRSQLAEKSNKWEFDEGGTKEGTGTRSRQNAQKNESGDSSGIGVNELPMEKMVSGAKKWEFTDKGSKKGGGVASRTPAKNEELSKEDMGKLAQSGIMVTDNGTNGNTGIKQRKWKFDEKEPATKEGQGTASRKEPVKEEPSKTDLAVIAEKNKGAKNTNNKTEGNTGIEPRSWKFDEKEPASKEGQGTASRVPPRVAETPKSTMIDKAAKHVKQSITDFLMG